MIVGFTIELQSCLGLVRYRLKRNGQNLVALAEVCWLLVPTMGQAAKTLDPTLSIRQLSGKCTSLKFDTPSL